MDGATITRPSPAPWPPRYSVSRASARRLRTIERLDERLQAREFPSQAWRRLLREALSRNAYATASIEGNPLSLDEVRRLLAKSPSPSNLLEPDEREIINFAKILDALADHPAPTRVSDVNRLHAEYFDGVLERPGVLKQRQNAVVSKREGRVLFVPTAPNKVRKELQAALDWWAGSDEHPLVKSSLFFHEFQSIHPYADGNGRLGRLLTTLQLWHSGYHAVRAAFLDYAINEDRDAYYVALDAARGRAWDRSAWLEHFLPTIEDAYQRAIRRALLLESLPDRLRERQVRIVEWMSRATRTEPRRRFKLADLHEAFPAAPLRTLSSDLAVLVAEGILERHGTRKAARYRLQRRQTPASSVEG